MPNQFFSAADGDLENYFVTDYWIIDQYIGDQMWAWGNNGAASIGTNTGDISTPATIFGSSVNWKQVSGSYRQSAGVKTDGTLWTWGGNSNGSLGNPAAAASQSTPITTFAGGTDWKQVTVGYSSMAAIKTDGTLWTWGGGANGRLGNASIAIATSTPITTFAGGTDWKQVSFSEGQLSTTGQSCAAVKTDGTLWVWGNGSPAGLGSLNDNGSISTPTTTFTGGTNWKQVSAGVQMIAAIKTDGTLWTWGNNTNGILGRQTATLTRNTASTPVTTFAGGTDWRDTATGEAEELHTISMNGSVDNSVAIKTDGTLWTWGAGGNGQLGNASITSVSTPITTFAGGTNWKQISSGGNCIAAIKTDGTLWTWGLSSSGQLGNASITSVSTPITTFAGGNNWKQVIIGTDNAAAIKTDGTLWTWGSGADGRLGNASTTNVSTPITTFAGGTDWKSIASQTTNQLAAIKTDGTLWTWGNGLLGRLGNASTTNVSTPVTTFAGGTNWKQAVCSTNAFMSAIKTDGTLWTWGYTSEGALGNAQLTLQTISTPITTFAGGTNWKQVAHIKTRSLGAVKTDGTLWVWGEVSTSANSFLPVGPTPLRFSTPVTTFAGGTNWTQLCGRLALKTDGTLWTWGNGGPSSMGIKFHVIDGDLPSTTFAGGTNWRQVDVGQRHVGAVKTDGTLWVWGNTYKGALGNSLTTNTSVSTPITTFAGGNNWKYVSAGAIGFGAGVAGSTSAVKTDGTLWHWGFGSNGRNGNNTGSDASTPVTTFLGGTNWKISNTSCMNTKGIFSGIPAELPL